MEAPRSPAPPYRGSSEGTLPSPANLSLKTIPRQAKHENRGLWWILAFTTFQGWKPLVEKAEHQANPTSVKPCSHRLGKDTRWGEGPAPAPPPSWEHIKTGYRTDPETTPSKTRADVSMTSSRRPGDIISSVGISPRSGHRHWFYIFTEHQKVCFHK